MTSPTHDATAFAAALALFGSVGDPRGLVVASGCIAVQGVAAGWATWVQRRQEAALRARGLRDAQVRWHGPSRRTTRPLRLIAIIAAATAAPAAAVALASARLPDQLEVGPIDHRGLTHYLVTAAVLIGGVWLAAVELVPEYASLVACGVATGFVMHLLMDGCTRAGVPLFGPVWRRDIHLLPADLRIRTGDLWDTMLMTGALGAVVLAVAT